VPVSDYSIEALRGGEEITLETTAAEWKRLRAEVELFCCGPDEEFVVSVRDRGAIEESEHPEIRSLTFRRGGEKLSFQIYKSSLVIRGGVDDLAGLVANVDFPVTFHGAHTHFGPFWEAWVTPESVPVTFQHVERGSAL
jgi:hypothetical protein